MSLRAIADGVAIHNMIFAGANKFIITGLLRFARNDRRGARNDRFGAGHGETVTSYR